MLQSIRLTDENIVPDEHNEYDMIDKKLLSETQVLNALKEIESVFASNSAKWNSTCNALIKLRKVCARGGTEYNAFFMSLRSMKGALCDCLTSLRSVVVKESCETVVVIANKLVSSFMIKRNTCISCFNILLHDLHVFLACVVFEYFCMNFEILGFEYIS